MVGYLQRVLLGEAIPTAGMTQSDTMQVVGVLASVSERGEIDHFVDEAVFVPLENYLGVTGVDSLYVESDAAAFNAVGSVLEGRMTELDITGFELLPLAERYGIALREQVAQLLSGALGFGVVAALLTAAANLTAFYLSRALARIRQLGVRRAVGASAPRSGYRRAALSATLGAPGGALERTDHLPCRPFVDSKTGTLRTSPG